jgi:predicted dehydrogenase
VHLVVYFVRRWMPLWRRARELVDAGTIGTVRVIRMSLPNRIWSRAAMLSIWFNFWQAHFARSAHSRCRNSSKSKGASAAFFGFKSGAYGIFQVTGWKANYIVEAEIIGDEGRIFIREDTGLITVESFERSSKYDGYRELRRSVEEKVENAPAFSPFVTIADEISALL